MSATVVCDSSAVVALLLNGGPDGQWATEQLTGVRLMAPSLVMFETANIIRRHERAGVASPDQAVQAHADLLDLSIEQWPYELLGARVWELRDTLSSYDASYVALAELVGAPLVTLDRADQSRFRAQVRGRRPLTFATSTRSRAAAATLWVAVSRVLRK